MTQKQLTAIVAALDRFAVAQQVKDTQLCVMLANGTEFFGHGAWFDHDQTIYMLQAAPNVPPLYLDPAAIIGVTLNDVTREPANKG